MLAIRKALLNDLDSIAEIYNESILKTVATFDTEIKTYEEQKKWFQEHGPKNPILVAEQDGLVIGWAALSNYSTRCAYSDTAEISLYVREENQGKGIGKTLPILDIQQNLEEIKNKFIVFSSVETKLTQIDNASSYIRENLNKLKTDITMSLDSIKELLSL